MNHIAKELREVCATVRRKPYPLADLIPLMTRAADMLDERDQRLDEFTEELGACRNAFPIPEPGSDLERHWFHAMGSPTDVADYVRGQVAAYRQAIAERDARIAELEARPA